MRSHSALRGRIGACLFISSEERIKESMKEKGEN